MKLKTKQKAKRNSKQNNVPRKGSLKELVEYFGSYLSALETVNARH